MTWWATRSIRQRMTGSYTLALAVMLVVYATATYVAVRHEFFEQLDDELHDDFDNAHARLTSTADGRIIWSGEPPAERDRRIDVWSADDGPIYQSNPSAGWRPPVGTTEPFYESLVTGGSHWRALSGPVHIGPRTALVRVARSEELVRRQLWEVATVLVFGGPLIVILAGAGGYVLARHALAPIDHLASAARRITAARLHERLPVPNPHDEIGRLATVINETFARLDASFDSSTVRLTRERVDLGGLTTDVAASLSILAEERAQHLAVDAAEHVMVVADRLVLREALMNVIDNAIKYSPLSSTITLCVHTEDDEAVVTVADHGPGIPPDHRERVFDRFFRLDEGRSRDRGGTGLGLAIAKWAVDVNGGRISVDVGAHGGSVFRIVLPAASPPETRLTARPINETPTQLGPDRRKSV